MWVSFNSATSFNDSILRRHKEKLPRTSCGKGMCIILIINFRSRSRFTFGNRRESLSDRLLSNKTTTLRTMEREKVRTNPFYEKSCSLYLS